LCFDANAGAVKTISSNTAARIFFMLKMYHDPEASGSPGIARNQIRNEAIYPSANSNSGVN
jgi:hypothetical protein